MILLIAFIEILAHILVFFCLVFSVLSESAMGSSLEAVWQHFSKEFPRASHFRVGSAMVCYDAVAPFLEVCYCSLMPCRFHFISFSIIFTSKFSCHSSSIHLHGLKLCGCG